MKLRKGFCSVCSAELDDFRAVYPAGVCLECDRRAVNTQGQPPFHDSMDDYGDNPVFIDGRKCWRRYRFGGYVAMLDLFDCQTIGEFETKQVIDRSWETIAYKD